MLAFFTENLATIIISALIAAAVICIITKLTKDKKKGKLSCGCGCADCPSASICHQE